MRARILLSSLLSFAACTPHPSPSVDITQAPKINGAQISKVLARIKQEVGLFYSDGAKAERNWPELISSIDAHPICGNGHIAFQITSIKMDFEVVNDQSGGATGGLKIPFGPPAASGSISPGITGSKDTTGTIDLGYTYKPPASGPVDTDYDIIRPSAVILPALDSLRDGLIRATGYHPCFHSLGKKDPDQTLVFSVEVEEDRKTSLGFDFYLLSLSANKEVKNTGKNTITVSYRPIQFAGGEENLLALHKQLNLQSQY